jgi:site-specific DNA-cytosine methylase
MNNLGDISKIEELPYADLWTVSFPCTNISLSGKMEGLDKNSDTSSSLVWQQIRLFLELEYRGVNLKKLKEACESSDDEQKEYTIIREELDKVCQYLKL